MGFNLDNLDAPPSPGLAPDLRDDQQEARVAISELDKALQGQGIAMEREEKGPMDLSALSKTKSRMERELEEQRDDLYEEEAERKK